MSTEKSDNKNTKLHQVAIFPIPSMVSFPGITVPLHVFEPRYRSMIKHCESEPIMIAVAHTKKALNQNKKKSFSSSLNQNLSSYEPQDIFSAGFCETTETTEDGRLHVLVNVSIRLKLIEITQQVPFIIGSCQVLEDLETDDLQLTIDRMQEINELLQAISKSQSPELYDILKQDEWLNMTPQEFSFLVFKYFRFEADFMQQVLEQITVMDRLDLIWAGISNSLMR